MVTREVKVQLSIIVPFFNEEENLPLLCQRLINIVDQLKINYEIIFVDDGSIDNGFAILAELAKQNPHIKLIQFHRNFGQSAALAAGFDYAQGEVIVALDADLENDPDDIPSLLTELNTGYDIVSGWRKNRWQNHFFTRRLTSQTANWLTSKITGLKLYDYGCTLKAYRAPVIKNINLYGEMHRFIPALAYWQGARVKEIAVNYQPRQFGQSKYGTERILKVLFDLIVLKFFSGYANKPIYFFGKIGLFSLIFAFLTFLLATYYKINHQKSYIETPLPIVTALFIILAVLLTLIGLLAEIVIRLHHETNKKNIYSVKERINI